MPQPVSRPALTSAMAVAAVRASLERAEQMSLAITVTVVDAGGNLVIVHRMDGAPLVSLDTARLKAYTAAAIGAPGDDFYSAIADDPAAVASFGTRANLTLIAGGMPIRNGDNLLGGIGVAGAMTGTEDRAVAEAAVAAALA